MESKVFDPSLMENRFRHEFKYLSTLGQLKTIQVRLTGLIPLIPMWDRMVSTISEACILMTMRIATEGK